MDEADAVAYLRRRLGISTQTMITVPYNVVLDLVRLSASLISEQETALRLSGYNATVDNGLQDTRLASKNRTLSDIIERIV